MQIGNKKFYPIGPGRILIWTNPFSPRQVTVKASGSPRAEIVVRPWHTVIVDEAAVHPPAVLLLATPRLHAQLKENVWVLEVKVADRLYAIEHYVGQPVWIGWGSNVRIPAEIKESWGSDTRTFESFGDPISVDDGLTISANQAIDVSVLVPTEDDERRVFAMMRFVVRPPEDSSLPQVVSFEASEE